MRAAFFCWFFVIVFYPIAIRGQNMLMEHQYFMRINGHYGYLAPHHESIKYFVEDHISGFQIEGGWKVAGDKKWHRDHNFPKTGIGYYNSSLGNDAVYGQAQAIYGFFLKEGKNHDQRIHFIQKFSFGISHLSQKYDLSENPYNLAISTNVNAYFAYMAGLNFDVNKQTALHTGVTFTHFSNGKIREPNKGLNNFAIAAGLTYNFNHQQPEPFSVLREEADFYPNRWSLFYAMGWKQISRRVDAHFFAASMALDYSFLALTTNRLGTGLDIFYDSSAEAHRAFDNQEMESEWEYFRAGIHLSYEFLIGRSSFVVQPGVYLFNPYPKYGQGYNRLAFRYRLTPQLITSVGIKAHFPAKADFIEWGLGYAF